MKVTNILFSISLALSVNLLVGSCQSKTYDLQTSLNTQIDSASNHLLQFSNFKKVNGVEIQSGSLKYEMAFTGRIDAKENCYWDGSISYLFMQHDKIRLPLIIKANDSLKADFLKKDYGYDIKGTAVFEKRDSGWEIIGIYFQ
jgi:hypothetical protein